MTRHTIHLPVAEPDDIANYLHLATIGEELGYTRAWMPETWGRDAITTLTMIGEHTSDIGLGTSITPVYSRSPVLIGQTAATLHERSGGRFRLGLGPSGPAVVENWHGTAFDRPLRRTRETIDIVRQVLTGDVVNYDGDLFDLSGFRLRSPPPAAPPAIDVAGMGPTAVELAGRFADGWHALLFTPEGLRERLTDFNHGAELAGHSPTDRRVTLSLTCCALDDGDRARELVRQHIAFYLGGMGTFYRDALARQGHGDTAHTVHDAWQAGERAEAMAALEPLLDELAVAGSPQAARDTLSRFTAIDGLDAVAIGFPRGATLEEQTSTLDALAPT